MCNSPYRLIPYYSDEHKLHHSTYMSGTVSFIVNGVHIY